MGETKMVAVDGRDALCYVIVRSKRADEPGDPAAMVVESAANGMSYREAAYTMYAIAKQFNEAADAKGEPTMNELRARGLGMDGEQ